MNGLTIVLFLVAAWNPARARLAGKALSAAIAIATMLALGAVAIGDAATGALEVTAPTMRLAGAIVVGLLGARTLFVPVESWTARWPLLSVVSVELVVAGLAVGAPGWRNPALIGVALAAGLSFAVGAGRLGEPVTAWLGRGCAVLAVVLGVLVGVVAVQTV